MPENNLLEGTLLEGTNQSRRRRYTRSPSGGAFLSLTPVRVRILRYLAELRFLSLPQIAKVCCPSGRQDLSEKSARRHMRGLFDSGLVDVLPVSRAALAPPGVANEASLLYGSAPNVYAPSAHGLETLYRAGLIERDAVKRPPAYGPKNSLFLAHELAVRDVRVWLETTARCNGYELERWHDGEASAIRLHRDQELLQAPISIRPDAWFVLRLSRAVLVGLVEVDRGTERGERRWREKFDAYETLFASGHLPAVTGYLNARVLVVTPDERRRDQLANAIQEFDSTLASRFWTAELAVLEETSLLLPQWRQRTDLPLRPLISSNAGL